MNIKQAVKELKYWSGELKKKQDFLDKGFDGDPYEHYSSELTIEQLEKAKDRAKTWANIVNAMANAAMVDLTGSHQAGSETIFDLV